MENQDLILQMRHISKQFPGVKALDNVDFSVRAGTVHALVGENGAGKSTLMKIIGGIYSADANSEIIFKGNPISNYTPREAIDMGIAIIHQELSPILDMNIAENIFLGQETTRFGFVEKKKLEKQASELLHRVGVDYNPEMKMRELTVSEMQMVEITKCIFRNATLIIMDEPTSSLMDTEIEHLFEQIQKLKEQGVGIIYISHKMDEIFRIADEITVMRDGQKVSSGKADEYNMETIITQMVGRKIDSVFPKADIELGDTIMEVKGFTGPNGKFRDVSFSLREGEVLGLTGLVGAGRTELVRAIFGLDPKKEGELYIRQKKVNVKSPQDALRYGIAMLSEDRRLFGLILCRSIRENMTLSSLNNMTNGLFLDNKKEDEKVEDMISMLDIKIVSVDNTVSSLSGGNQQKVVLAKWLLRDVDILILDEPTRGIDVGAKHEIYTIIGDMVRAGKSIVIISSEMPEIMGLCDRVLVMSNGEITGEMDREHFDNEEIMKASMANL